MRKLILGVMTLGLLPFVIGTTNASLLREVSCSNYGNNKSDCNQCFDGGHVYKGRAKTISDYWNNYSNKQDIYYKNENQNNVKTYVLNGTTWFVSTNLTKYTNDFVWKKGGRSGKQYHSFSAKKTGVKFIETRRNGGIKLTKVSSNTSRNKAGYKVKFIANYHKFDGRHLGPKIRHTECIFFKPAWCGDGVIDRNQGEECDPKASGYNNQNCSSSCRKITPKTYDLALKKTIVNAKNSYAPGNTITFNITVYNQGQLDAKNIKIVDYLENGFDLVDNKWTKNGNKAYYTITSIIKPGKSKTVSIKLKIKSNVYPGPLVNWSEIASDNGNDIDSKPDSNRANDCHGGDGPVDGKPNVIDNDQDDNLNGKGDQDHDGSCEEGEDEDDHDPALIQIGYYDLALKKTVVNPMQKYKIGDVIKYNIRIVNQGTINAHSIQVVDYVPNNMEIVDSSWSYNNTTRKAYKIVNNINAGTSKLITIELKLIGGNNNERIVNYAEISVDDGNDCDSTPDDTNGNGVGENSGLVNDNIGNGCNSGGDEDDHDPATIIVDTIPRPDCTGLTVNHSTGEYTCNGNSTTTSYRIYVNGNQVSTNRTGTYNITNPGVYNFECLVDGETRPADTECSDTVTIVPPHFDLALTKEVITPAPYLVGDTVAYRIVVTNQGDIDATNVKVVDYVPNNMELLHTSGNWSVMGANRKTYMTVGNIAAGQSKVIYIRFKIGAGATGTITNWSEISHAEGGTDCDSTPDDNQNNDDYNHDYSNSNPNPNGCNPNDGDEDDHDPASITISVPVYDLALRKTIVGNHVYHAGDEIEYNIEVINQGTIDAHNIEITDYIPNDMTLVAGNGWSAMGADRKVKQTIASIPALTSQNITIKLKVNAGIPDGRTIVNYAEISADDGNDCDSTPDDTNGNTTGEQNGHIIDDDIGTGCNPGGDEDDHDLASVILGNGPICGTANGDYYSTSTTTWPAGETFCARGTANPVSPSFPTMGGTTTWKCEFAGNEVSCSASRSSGGGGGGGGGHRYYCGDNKLNQGGVPYEECDEGTLNGNVNINLNFNSTQWNNLINHYRSIGNNDRADKLQAMRNSGNSKLYCSTNCTISQKSSCAVDGTCPPGHCGPLAGNPLTPAQYSTLIKYFKKTGGGIASSYRNEFCSGSNDVFSVNYNNSVGHNELSWYCGITRCSMSVNDGNGFIKIYGSYKNAWTCPECLGFDQETDDDIRRTFLTNYDTKYTRSIMQGDYLPIGFAFNNYNSKYVWKCDSTTEGKYNIGHFNIKFKIDGTNKTFIVQDLKAFPDASVIGQAYLSASNTSLTPGEHKIDGYTKVQECKGTDTDGDGVKDTYNWVYNTINQHFASKTFTVTKPYMLQLGNVISNSSNVDPRFNNKPLSDYGIPSANTTSSYDKTELSNAISKFVNKYKQYATLPGIQLLNDSSGYKWNKVPTQEVYYTDQGNVFIGNITFTKPTTLIVNGKNVTVVGDITGPVMVVVKGGNIKIANQSMNKRTFMEGYYFTDGKFEVVGPAVTHGNILNKNPNSVIWYADGRLVVKGVLIGKDADKVYKRRRSVLKNWFRASPYGKNYAVRNGAGLSIIPSSTLWANPPIGSKDLFQMLKVKKGN